MLTTMDTTRPPQRAPRSPPAVAAATDRERAFRAARRHTWLVRGLRVVLPAASVVIVVAYGVTTWRLMEFGSAGIKSAGIRISTESLVMASPSYNGWAKDGARYHVRARSAKSDLAMQGPIRLDGIEADLEQTSGVTTHMTSVWGTFDQKKNELDLHERIDITATNGMTARLTRALVLVKEGRVVSQEPITFSTPTANVAAQSMVLLTKDRKATFKGDVTVRLEPAKPAAETEPRRQPTAVPVIGGQSGEPIHVTSTSLDVDDEARTAIFRERVVARQGDSRLEAPIMTIAYVGQDASAARTPALPGTGGDAQAAKLREITATGGIVMTRGGDRATAQSLAHDAVAQKTRLAGPVRITSGSDRTVTGRSAEIDHAADRIGMTGDVVIVQGKNILKGEQLSIDRPAGRSRLSGGRVTARLHPPESRGKTGEKAKGATDDGAGDGLLGRIKVEPGQPIDIVSDTLEVLDAKHTAHFAGSVSVKQGEFLLTTPSLTAHYTGQTGLTAAQPGAAANAELKKIEARNGVTLVAKDGQRVNGDWADFDPKSNFAVVGGRVVVTQGKNAVEGSKLVIDLTTGRSRFETATPAAGAPVAGRPAASPVPCAPGQTCTQRGRVRAVFYPKDLSRKKGDGPTLPTLPGRRPRPGESDQRPGASSWRSTTSPPQGAEVR